MISLIDIHEVEQSEQFLLSYFSKIKIGDEPVGFNVMHGVVHPLCGTDRDQHAVRECWFITQGSGILTLHDTESIPVGKGQLYFFDSMVSHQLQNTSPDMPLELVSIWW